MMMRSETQLYRIIRSIGLMLEKPPVTLPGSSATWIICVANGPGSSSKNKSCWTDSLTSHIEGHSFLRDSRYLLPGDYLELALAEEN